MKAYKIKLEVKNSHPPVWRRAMIPVALTFHQLNIVLNKILELDKKDRGLFEFYHINIRICEKPDRNIDGGYAYYDSKMTLIEAYFDSQNWFTFKNIDVAWRVTIEEVVNDCKEKRYNHHNNYLKKPFHVIPSIWVVLNYLLISK